MTGILLREEIKRLRKGLKRLASSQAFDMPGWIDPVRDRELIMRMEYARELLKPRRKK